MSMPDEKIYPASEIGLVHIRQTITDLSQRAVSFARIIDRLEPGTYTMTVEKDTDGRRLHVVVVRNETNQEWEL